MSIGVDGQFYLNFKVGNNDNFLTKDDFIEFTVYEYPGNLLPTFEWSFRTQDESVLKRLNEGNLLQAQYGRTRDDLVDVQLSPSSVNTFKDGENFSVFNITGFASQISYVTNHNLQITPEQSAVEAIIAVAQANGFVVQGNIQTSRDKQRWIQPNISDKSFVNDTYLRADVQNGAVSVAITADGQFIVKDILSDIERPANNRFDWKFTKSPQTEKDVVYDSDGSIESQAGFINNWIGYGRAIKLIDNETGDVSDILEQPDVILSLSNALDKYSAINDRYGGVRFQSESVHSSFWERYNHNLIFLANLSKISNTFSVSDRYFPIKPLDLCMYSEEGTINNVVSSDFKSGLYVCSGVIRTFQADRTNTTLILNREAFNEVINEA